MTEDSQSEEIVLGKILGIDFGERKVGLATADTETKMAFAYGVLENGLGLLGALKNIIAKEGISLVVVGLPSYTNRETVDYPSEIFARELAAETGLEVVLQNEMFSTKMAKANLLERGVKAVDKHDDAEAARIILQSWLDRQ